MTGVRPPLRAPRVAMLGVVLAGAGAGCEPIEVGTAPPECEFPTGVALSFAGDTTLGEVGLAAPGGETLRARAWITADPILFESAGTTTRVICARLEDGTFTLSPYPVPDVPNEGG
jgi:hypothetical protein